MSVLRWLFLMLALVATPASALDFPKLTGRVVDAANLLSPQDEAELDQKLAGVEQASSRQLVIATIPDLQGDEIADYGYQLGRTWGIGQKGANNGMILIVAPNEHKVRIEVGYGLEPIMTDALSSVIINTQIVPRFKANDYPGGIKAGANAIIEQLQAPPEQAEQRALAAKQQQAQSSSQRGQQSGSFFPLIFWIIVLVFIVIPMLRRRGRGRRYRRGGMPVVLWGPTLGGWGGGGGGGGSWGGGGGGGFSGGGGSFGGGGASGSW